MRLCTFQVKLRVPDDLTEYEQDELLDAVDALNLPHRLRRCVRTTLDHFLPEDHVEVSVEE
jgi:hypothetical protein